jgi:hypothetical protein
MKPKSKLAAAKPQRRFPRAAAIVLAVAVVAAGAYWWNNRQAAGTLPAAVAVNATNPPVLAATASQGFAKLTGKWLRPDGGYILEIKSVDDTTGKLEASYSNPRPINVSKAEASREGSGTKVFIELRAPNYPGSTYTLAYDPAADQLKGIYYQAALGQQFEVVFERTK